MRLRNLLLLVLIFMSKPLMAAEDFVGTWIGDVQEQGQESPYPITLTIFERGGRVFQNARYGPPLDCDAGGLLIERSTGMLHLSEFIMRNRDQCADGTIRLYLNGDETLIWEWFDMSGAYLARAELTPAK